MLNTGTLQVLEAARESLARRFDFDDVLAGLAPKDRVNAERRVSVLEAEPDPRRAPLWQRLTCTLMSLAQAAKFVGRQAVQFYVADGKYRMQVFALEDVNDGNLTIYCPDVLEEATTSGVVAPSGEADAHLYAVGAGGEELRIDSLDGRSINPGAHFKDLLGWNRKALRITLPPSSSPAQVQASELLCAIAAQHFVRAAPDAPAGGLRRF